MFSSRRTSAVCAGVLLAACALMASCTAASSGTAETDAVSVAASAVSESGLTRTQTSTVKNTTYEKEPEFSAFLEQAEAAYAIPGLNEGMIPQGMDWCESNGLLYISGYYSVDGTASALVAVDVSTGEIVAEYALQNADGTSFDGHVGGVAVTDTTLYLSGKKSDAGYTVEIIPLADLPEAGSHTVTLSQQVIVPVSPSFLSYSGGYLWIGNFYHPGADYGLSDGMAYTTTSAEGDYYGCYILGYDLSEGELASDSVPAVVLVAPNKIQGMVLSNDGTVTLSQSYGRKNNSALLSYTLSLDETPDTTVDVGGKTVSAYILDSLRLQESITAMPMTEALADQGEDLLILFESGALHYENGLYRTDQVWRISF